MYRIAELNCKMVKKSVVRNFSKVLAALMTSSTISAVQVLVFRRTPTRENLETQTLLLEVIGYFLGPNRYRDH